MFACFNNESETCLVGIALELKCLESPDTSNLQQSSLVLGDVALLVMGQVDKEALCLPRDDGVHILGLVPTRGMGCPP